MTSSTLTSVVQDTRNRLTPEQAQSAVGTLSVALGAVAVLAPARTAAFFGVRETGGAVPLLVRMVGVRNAVAGVRTLQADELDRTRALQAGLALGAVDATAVVLAARRGAMSKRSAAAALALLAGIAWLGVIASAE